MSGQHPDRDSLSAFLDDSLSIDATQWIEHHLETCSACQDKLEEERTFIAELDALATIKAPDDFTEGVMARVAQYPAYQPGVPSVTEVPWRRAAMWAGGAVAAMLTLAVFVGWVLVTGSAPQEAGAEAGSSSLVASGAEATKNLYFYAREQFELVTPMLQAGFMVLLGVVDFIRNAGFAVQIALLMITVGLNYALTRMVLNYQRRQ